MKKSLLYLSISLIALIGCSKSEESAVASNEPAAPAPPTETVETAEMAKAAESAKPTDSVEKAVANTMSTASGLVSQEVVAAKTKEMASSINWDAMSWDKVSEIPYENKEQLAAWASTKVEDWKGKLTDAVKGQGLSMLNNLGDSGWQGAMKGVVDAIKQVRESNPETWDMAKGALISSWQTFEAKAKDYISAE